MANVNRRLEMEMRRFAERARDRGHNSKLSDLDRELTLHRSKVEYTVRVLWECLTELGVTREDFERKMKEIEERGWTINPTPYYRMCPKCGKKVFDYTDKAFEATCMYCGQIVNMYPGDIEE